MCSWNLCDFCQQVNDIHVYHYLGLVEPGGGGGGLHYWIVHH